MTNDINLKKMLKVYRKDMEQKFPDPPPKSRDAMRDSAPDVGKLKKNESKKVPASRMSTEGMKKQGEPQTPT